MFIWITVRLDSPIWNKWWHGRLGSQTPILLSSNCLIFFDDIVSCYHDGDIGGEWSVSVTHAHCSQKEEIGTRKAAEGSLSTAILLLLVSQRGKV